MSNVCMDINWEDYNLSDSCRNPRQGACTGTASTSNTPTDLNIAASSSLNSYVGSGTVSATRTAPTLMATQSNNVFTGIESTQYTLAWAGSLSLTYEYLLHAASSFDGSSSLLTLDLDFGTVFLGDIVGDLGFSIYNRAGDRVGLDLDSFDSFTGPFSTNLSTFSALSQGASNLYSVSFDTSSPGVYNASYTLNLSDADVGAESSRKTYSMILNLTGSVDERPTSVPEPGALTLLGIGLLGFGFARRKT